MNDHERELWIENDEGLYLWWKATRLSISRFIRTNRVEITRAIERSLGTGND